jgi:hypothetical protein
LRSLLYSPSYFIKEWRETGRVADLATATKSMLAAPVGARIAADPVAASGCLEKAAQGKRRGIAGATEKGSATYQRSPMPTVRAE